jgi:hypothetical protein
MTHVVERWPAALPLYMAAEYCSLSVDTFKEVCPVKPVQFTQSTRGDRYLRTRLDAWLDTLDHRGATRAFATKPVVDGELDFRNLLEDGRR